MGKIVCVVKDEYIGQIVKVVESGGGGMVR